MFHSFGCTYCGTIAGSDDDDTADDDYFEEGGMFSRLEEIRAMLENELGIEVFLKAYQTVQVRIWHRIQLHFFIWRHDMTKIITKFLQN